MKIEICKGAGCDSQRPAGGTFLVLVKNGLLALFLSLSAPVFLCASAFRAQAFTQVTAKLSGRISAAGSHPTPKALPVFKNRAFCGPQVVNETLLITRDGGLKNAVVVLRALDGPVALRPRPLILDNQHCAFAPHVQVAPVGSELSLKNSDPILHTVHARLGNETLFNVGLPKWRAVTKRLDRAGVVRIDCDVLHTWMSAAIVVTDSPYFAVSDEHGLFFIHDLPIGSYDMEVWHERLGTWTQQLSFNDRTGQTVDVVFSTEKIR